MKPNSPVANPLSGPSRSGLPPPTPAGCPGWHRQPREGLRTLPCSPAVRQHLPRALPGGPRRSTSPETARVSVVSSPPPPGQAQPPTPPPNPGPRGENGSVSCPLPGPLLGIQSARSLLRPPPPARTNQRARCGSANRIGAVLEGGGGGKRESTPRAAPAPRPLTGRRLPNPLPPRSRLFPSHSPGRPTPRPPSPAPELSPARLAESGKEGEGGRPEQERAPSGRETRWRRLREAAGRRLRPFPPWAAALRRRMTRS